MKKHQQRPETFQEKKMSTKCEEKNDTDLFVPSPADREGKKNRQKEKKS